VIRALNDDTPFDRFIAEQLAADRLQPQPEPWRLAAMGFLTLGRIFDNNPHDVIDDRIDVTTRGFLGSHGRLRALPRPQVRRDLLRGLLRALRRVRELRGARRATSDRL
jgi:hypothetical protein